MKLHLVGFTVMQCRIAYQFCLDLARPAEAVRAQKHASITIEGPFEYITDGTHIPLDAAQHPEELGPALKLSMQTVEAASTSDDGSLQLLFRNGDSLHVPSLPDYEAWNMVNDNGELIVCMPGGELATWSERSTTPLRGANARCGSASR